MYSLPTYITLGNNGKLITHTSTSRHIWGIYLGGGRWEEGGKRGVVKP